MCGGCAGLGQNIGNMVVVVEKLASFVAMTSVVLCMMFTVTIMLGLGIGLGYNYCYVDLKVLTPSSSSTEECGHTASEMPTEGAPESTPEATPEGTPEVNTEGPEGSEGAPDGTFRARPRHFEERPLNMEELNYRRHQATPSSPLRRTPPLPAIQHTMVIPLNGEFDFLGLLSKLRSRNRNVTLELIT